MAQSIKKTVQPEEKVETKEEVLTNDIKNDSILDNQEEIKKEDIPEVKSMEEVLPSTREQREIDELKAENKAKDDKINELSQMMEKMQAQMAAFMKGAASMSSSRKDESEDILVGCRRINGGALATSDERLSFVFNCDEEKYIDSEDLKDLLRDSKRNNRKNFEEDSFYFVDKSNYEKFKIKKRIDLSPENIARILNLPVHDMIDEFNILTNNKNSFWIMHEFQFQVVKMLVKNDERLTTWSYESRNALEKYIGQKFDYLMASIGALELLGRHKYNK